MSKVEVRKAGKKGKGVFALRDFKKGNTIFRYKKGRIVKRKYLKMLSKKDQKHLGEIDKDKFEVMVPPGVYVNHSCDPNSIDKKRSFIALRKISKGEEITTDYRMHGLFHNKWRCHCGSKNCKGWIISDFFTLSKKLQKKYLPYTISYIRKEYKRRNK